MKKIINNGEIMREKVVMNQLGEIGILKTFNLGMFKSHILTIEYKGEIKNFLFIDEDLSYLTILGNL
jgi:hypothetical protein